VVHDRYANSKPKSKSSRSGRVDGNVWRQALRPVAESLGKSTEAAWRRYKNVATEHNKYAGERLGRGAVEVELSGVAEGREMASCRVGRQRQKINNK